MQDDARETVRRLAAYAALPLAPERIEALAVTLPVISAGLSALAAFDYGEAEPANIFVPPRKEAPP